jgi:hypothetical protein
MYEFGIIVIDGSEYRSDVIISNDRVQDNWWRKEGHRLALDDIKREVENVQPEVVIVGTGYYGLMQVNSETRRWIESKGMKLIVKKTREAVTLFNELSRSKRVLVALHLTC